ncbi:MAG: DUF1343 domain-containing protein [Nitrospinae bacterium]|nr:DUF1343 domain-containing protein [Nitrospinota bacterium]
MNKVTTGLDRLLAEPNNYLKGKRIGLVVNHTSVAGDGVPSFIHFHRHPDFELVKLFAPEHGLYGVDQDMAEVDHGTEPATGTPIVSLYGKDHASLTPDPELMKGIDTLVFDIQDIGARYYTFIYTLANCMRTCKEVGVPVVVCDRPNPINGVQVDGNLVREGWHSFVGQYSLPNRHGMTVGELAQLFNDHFGIGCDLTVVPMQGWQREMWYDQTGLLWVAPSPNMPAVSTATVYPGMCLIEGTQLSEGRGTTLPFELCGAPGIDAHRLAEALAEDDLPGVLFRPQYFKPAFQKCAGEICGGVQLHVTGRTTFKPLITGIAVIRAVARLFPKVFQWRTKPYEFVSDRPAIDLLYGHPELRETLLNGPQSLRDIEDSWQTDLENFMALRNRFLLY